MGHNNNIINVVKGEAGFVDFPIEFILDIYKRDSSYIQRLTHIHPPNFIGLSGRDEMTMKTIAYAIYPFPIRLGVICETEEKEYGTHCLVENVFVGFLEPKEIWKLHGGERVFTILKESETNVINSQWLEPVIKISYNQE